VRRALDQIRPGLLADAGNVELARVGDDGSINLELQGACAICPAREMTLRLMIEPHLRKSLRGVTSVLAT